MIGTATRTRGRRGVRVQGLGNYSLRIGWCHRHHLCGGSGDHGVCRSFITASLKRSEMKVNRDCKRSIKKNRREWMHSLAAEVAEAKLERRNGRCPYLIAVNVEHDRRENRVIKHLSWHGRSS
ncbi:hypothetical protein OPV22_014310 [Ensete ventricosum]|uniref:Uncharacterized protein n=1 Tax=Ensete ventricosum TaxID=4639 RepID=A0AAV8PPY0_ENSVE|nr:hypothetical protein OPV22_014310 [Ensete ventricosum]